MKEPIVEWRLGNEGWQATHNDPAFSLFASSAGCSVRCGGLFIIAEARGHERAKALAVALLRKALVWSRELGLRGGALSG